MTDAPPERQQHCSYCGLGLGTFSRNPDLQFIIGRCCEGIAIVRPGRREPVRAPIPAAIPQVAIPQEPEPEDVEYREGVCQSCGGESFDVEYSESVTNYCGTRASSGDDMVVISYDYADTQDSETHEVEVDRVNCRECGAQYHGNWEWE